MTTVRKKKLLEFVIHFVGILLLLCVPLFLVERKADGIGMDTHLLKHHCLMLFFCVVAFYLNYLYLIPRYCFSDKKAKFFIINLIMVAVFIAVSQSWNMFDAAKPPFDMMDKPPHHRPDTILPHPILIAMRDVFLMILAISFSVAIKMGLRLNELEKARREAERERTEAELGNLRNQLNPHFLLNTLNNIYALIAFDKNMAQQAVYDLAKLLRYVLYENNENFVPLTREMEFIKNYIQLMRLRLPENVQVTTDFSVLEDSSARIAPLLFISLIENAFKHGISPDKPSMISVNIHQTADNHVVCNIQNSYHPKNEQDKSGSGIGLEQVRKRLELLYPNAYVWEMYLTDEKIYCSVLTIPLISC